jgi:hypothetical protein
MTQCGDVAITHPQAISCKRFAVYSAWGQGMVGDLIDGVENT